MGIAVLAVLVSPPVASQVSQSGTLSGTVVVVSAFVAAMLAALAMTIVYVCTFRGRRLAWAFAAYLAVVLVPVLVAVGAYEVVEGLGSSGASRVEGRYDFAEYDGQAFRVVPYAFKTNRQGWRSDFDYDGLEADDTAILLIGDSMVYGAVDQPDTLANRLAALTASKVMNASRVGAAIPDYVRFAEAFRTYRPGAVALVVYAGNDFPADPGEIRASASAYGSLRAAAKGALEASRLVVALATAIETRRHWQRLDPSVSARVPKRSLNPASLLFLASIDDEDFRRRARTFESAGLAQADILRIRRAFPNSRFYLAIVPVHVQVSPRYVDAARPFGFRGAAPINADLQRAIVAWAHTQGICTLDLLPALADAEAAGGAPLFHLLDAHPNAAGNRAIAAHLAARLASPDPCR